MDWELGFSDSKEEFPENYLTAYVPSEVQLIYKKNDKPEDYNYGSNYLDYKWMENKWWFYKTTLEIEKRANCTPILLFKGIDYKYTIFINNLKIVEDEGMFTPIKINLDKYAGTKIDLTVVLHPIPKKIGAEEGRDEASLSCKPAVSYGWDWHPRLVPIGIYDDVEILYKPNTYIDDFIVNYIILEDFTLLNGSAVFKVLNPAGVIKFEIVDKQNNIVISKKVPASDMTKIDFEIANPILWWCVNQGEQYLYKIKIYIEKENDVYLDYESTIGFRRIKLVMNADAWEVGPFPVTQGKPPITIELNGRKIFGKGTNFVPPEIFASKLNRETYRKLLVLAKDCNMNLIRVWGGGLVNKDSFFELCDEMGLMVWQEFPLACNNYEDDVHYLSVLDKESKSIIRRLKKHPCVILWCGGNELFCSWGGMTNQSLALRLLDKSCYELDPYTPYIMSSPQYGMGHGNYMPLAESGKEAISEIIDSDFTAYTEFGMPAPSPFEYIKQFTPKEEWYNVSPQTAWEHHHAINAWDTKANTWFCIKEIREYFGQESNLEELIENGMILQYEIYKNLFEEARRKWPKTSMALNWCYNEPWPTAANNSIINYPDIPKHGYYGVQKALRNQMLSARIYKMIWTVGENIEIEIFVLNDLQMDIPPLKFRVLITGNNNEKIADLGEYFSENCKSNSVCETVTVAFGINEIIPEQFKLILLCEQEQYDNEYLLFCKR